MHLQFNAEQADPTARRVLMTGIEAFPARNRARVHIPQIRTSATVGFSVEEILEALGGSLAPLVEQVVKGTIRGIAGIVGCNNVKVPQDSFHRALTTELIRRDILVLGAGCWAIAAAKAGLMDLSARASAGAGLSSFCQALWIARSVSPARRARRPAPSRTTPRGAFGARWATKGPRSTCASWR